jgi:hypothetical protein
MSPSSWGPPTWIFIHTLAAKVKESNFPTIGPGLLTLLFKYVIIYLVLNVRNTQKNSGEKLKYLI